MLCPVSALVMLTLAPGMAAPLGSVIVPEMLPVLIVVWAVAVPLSKKHKENATTTTDNTYGFQLRDVHKRFIVYPPQAKFMTSAEKFLDRSNGKLRGQNGTRLLPQARSSNCLHVRFHYWYTVAIDC